MNNIYNYKFSSILINTNYSNSIIYKYLIDEFADHNTYKFNSSVPRLFDTKSIDGILSDKKINLLLSNNSNFIKISAEKCADFLIDINKQEIQTLNILLDKDDELLLEAFLGPALITLFSKLGIFCLHCSGVRYHSTGILFIGDSGAGKSTISSYLNSKYSEVERISDDLLPVKLKNGSLYGYPQFPQLKLPESEQYGLDKDEKILISNIYLINNTSNEVAITDMDTQNKAINLIKHTVASVIFDEDTKYRHLKFCAEVTPTIKAKELSFKHNLKLLPQISDIIIKDIESN